MFYVSAFLIATISPIVWVLNAETIAVFTGLVGNRPWPLVALILSLGQCVTFSLLYLGGEGLIRRVPRFRRKIETLEADPVRFERYRRGASWTLLGAAALGIPPLVAMAALAPAFGVRFRTFAVVALGGRALRFFLLAGLPTLFADYVPLDALPDWLRSL